MKTKFTLFLTLFFFACGFEEPQNDNELPLSEEEKEAEAYKKQFRWGFINIKGKLIIQAEYEEVGNFSEGLCAVKQNNRWGFIDKTGKIVVEPKYKAVWEFFDGLAEVLDEKNKVGFINQKGEMAIKPQYESAWNDDPILVKKEGKYFYINRENGEKLSLGGFRYATPFTANKWAIVETQKGYGCIQTNGNYLIEPQYDELKTGGDNFIGYRKNGKWGILNEAGDIIIEAKFQDIGKFENNVTYAVKTNRYGLIDTTGQFIIEPQYAQIWYAQEGLWAIVNNDGKHGFIDSEGKIILPPTYDTVLRFQEGRTAIMKDELWAYINPMGQRITSFEYSLAWNFSEGLARAVSKNGEQVFINKKGKIEFIVDFEDVRDFHEGLARVQLKISN